MEQQSGNAFMLGINNGIIVGFQVLNTQPNGGFVAYDVQCPNCVRKENNTIMFVERKGFMYENGDIARVARVIVVKNPS